MAQEKKDNLFDILNDINFTKKGIYHESDHWEKLYNTYIINMLLSQHVDAIFIVNELNMRGDMPKRWHHDFLLHSLSKKKRFAKLSRPAKSEHIDAIKEIFDYSNDKAMQVIDLFTLGELDDMVESLSKGGFSKGRR